VNIPEARAAYVALATAALKNLPVKNRVELEKEMRRTSHADATVKV
jgi:hypothetical protein